MKYCSLLRKDHTVIFTQGRCQAMLSVSGEVRCASRKEIMRSKLNTLKVSLKSHLPALVLIRCWLHNEKLIWLGKKADKSMWLRKTRPEEAVPTTVQESTLWNHRDVGGRSKFHNCRWYAAAYWSLPDRTVSAPHSQFAWRRQKTENQILLQHRNYFKQSVHHLHEIVHHGLSCLVSSKSLHTPGLWDLRLQKLWKGLSKSAVKL